MQDSLGFSVEISYNPSAEYEEYTGIPDPCPWFWIIWHHNGPGWLHLWDQPSRWEEEGQSNYDCGWAADHQSAHQEVFRVCSKLPKGSKVYVGNS